MKISTNSVLLWKSEKAEIWALNLFLCNLLRLHSQAKAQKDNMFLDRHPGGALPTTGVDLNSS